MIPREILKKIRQIELRTNRLVSETLAGQYHSVFKGQGMNFEEVREYQPGDEVRAIDWNAALEFLSRVTSHRAIAVIISDFLGPNNTERLGRFTRASLNPTQAFGQASLVPLRQANRRHDVVAVQITDRYEMEMPALG